MTAESKGFLNARRKPMVLLMIHAPSLRFRPCQFPVLRRGSVLLSIASSRVAA